MKNLPFYVVAVIVFTTTGCGDVPSPTASLSDLEPGLSVASASPGKIVYSGSGTLRVYDVSTKSDVSLGISGVNPKFSPSGALIVFQSGGGIRLVNSDGTNNRVLNSTGGVPSFDPSGTMIVYNDNGIWKINADGTGRVQLTTDGGHWPAWSPDGTQIAYGAAVGKLQQLFIVNADGSNRHRALTSGGITDVVWQPSPRILFAINDGNYDLYSWDPAGASAPARLTTSKDADFEPSWSPDATRVSWTSGTSGRSAGIWTMNSDGSSKVGPVVAKGRQGSWGL